MFVNKHFRYLCCYNAKPSAYYFYVKRKISVDFQICISVPLTPLSFKISLKDKSFHVSINSLGLYLFSECLLNFLSNFCMPSYVQKMFKFMELTFLENALIGGIFTHAHPHSKLAPKFLPSRPRRKEITHCPIRHPFENL